LYFALPQANKLVHFQFIQSQFFKKPKDRKSHATFPLMIARTAIACARIVWVGEGGGRALLAQVGTVQLQFHWQGISTGY
jgi:hypothetical protein